MRYPVLNNIKKEVSKLELGVLVVFISMWFHYFLLNSDLYKGSSRFSQAHLDTYISVLPNSIGFVFITWVLWVGLKVDKTSGSSVYLGFIAGMYFCFGVYLLGENALVYGYLFLVYSIGVVRSIAGSED